MNDRLPMIEKATMTLNLPQREMEMLEELRLKNGMTKTAIVRQALRLYQSVNARLQRGEQMVWLDKDGKRTGILPVGCGELD